MISLVTAQMAKTKKDFPVALQAQKEMVVAEMRRQHEESEIKHLREM